MKNHKNRWEVLRSLVLETAEILSLETEHKPNGFIFDNKYYYILLTDDNICGIAAKHSWLEFVNFAFSSATPEQVETLIRELNKIIVENWDVLCSKGTVPLITNNRGNMTRLYEMTTILASRKILAAFEYVVPYLANRFVIDRRTGCMGEDVRIEKYAGDGSFLKDWTYKFRYNKLIANGGAVTGILHGLSWLIENGAIKQWELEKQVLYRWVRGVPDTYWLAIGKKPVLDDDGFLKLKPFTHNENKR